MTILQHDLAPAAGSTAYQISRSLRFNAPDGAYLTRTIGTPTSGNTWTLSFWLKRANITYSQFQYIWSYDSSARGLAIDYSAGSNPDCLYIYNGTTSSYGTTRKIRDPGAWDHYVLSCNAGTASLYKTGESSAYITASSMPSMSSGMAMQFGRLSSSGLLPLDAYLADVHFIDGQALTPTSFGQTDATTGVWVPKAYAGTYGNNGFKLTFSDNSNTTAATLGADSSGNGNNWTPNNFSVTAGVGNDSLVDSPTWYGTDTGAGGEVRGNYCTLNPLNSGGTLANGNLQMTTVSAWASSYGTILIPTTGKWYWEVVCGAQETIPGIAVASANLIGNATTYPANSIVSYTYYGLNGNKYTGPGNTNVAYGATFTANDVIGVAFDADAGTLAFYKNGTSQGTAFTGLTSQYVPVLGVFNTSSHINFGQRPFAYTAPSGFKALCTTNLPTPAIGASAGTLASKNMDVSLYTGTGSSQNIVNSGGFQPDLVWVKSRSSAYDHVLVDSVRGVSNALFSNGTFAEAYSANGYVTGFNSNGFALNLGTGANGNGSTYVGWQWKAGGTAVSNTAGSISSQVSANTAAGISIVTYTGLGAGGSGTVGHGLGAAPKLIICKSRNNTPNTAPNWPVYHVSIGKDAGVCLNNTNAIFSSSNYWGTTAPNSSTFGVVTNGDNNNGNMVAYCFAEVPGFSKFGSYTGNGSTDGPFVYCGFRPRFLLVKRTDAGTDAWILYDTARDTYNVASGELIPNSSGAESSVASFDMLSNGFKVRSSGTYRNGAGATYIFAAFAEHPFQYARAR